MGVEQSRKGEAMSQHFHDCDICGEATIMCDLPHCEYQDVELDEVIRQHWIENH